MFYTFNTMRMKNLKTMKSVYLTLSLLLLSLCSYGQVGAITGIMALCPGAGTTLSDTSAGGTWSSSDISVATVGSSSGVVIGVATGIATITYTTGTGSATTTVTVNPTPFEISGSLSICTGLTTTFVPNTGGGVWTSGVTGVAVIGSSSGVVVGVSTGISVLTYTLGVCSFTVMESVNPLPAAITGPSSVCTLSSISLGDLTTGGTWSSSNITVGSIDFSGNVTGNAVGLTTISYTLSTGCSTTKSVSVNPGVSPITGPLTYCVGSSLTLSEVVLGGAWSSSNPAVVSLTLVGVGAGTSVITYSVGTGCSTSVTVTVNAPPSGISGYSTVCPGTPIAFTDGTPGGIWNSSNMAVATVGSSTGIVTGITIGTATISYTIPSTGCYSTYPVTVNLPPGIITGPTALCTGGAGTLSCIVTGGTWSSGTPTVAAIGSSSGIVTGVAPGVATITYSITPGCATTTHITVNPLPPAISGPLAVCAGSSVSLSDGAPGGTWASSSTGIATVGSSSGSVTGVSAGTAVITYTLATGCQTTRVVTVNFAPLPITGTTYLCAGSTTTLSDATPGGTWSSSSIPVGTVSSSGVVAGLTPGTSNITYTIGTGCFATSLITVNPNPASIGGPNAVCVGATVIKTDATAGGIWTSSSPAIATVGTGDVYGITAGTTVISYTLPVTGCYSSATVTVNISPCAISGPATACIGATGAYSDCLPGGAWYSSSPAIATVGSTSGIITGITPGTTTITYQLPTGCNVTTPVTVNPSPSAITGTLSVCPGSSNSLIDGTPGGTWTSSNTSIATITAIGSTGSLTGVAAGTTIISYTLPTLCYATRIATVNPLPASYTVIGGGSYCAGGMGIHIQLSGSDLGINYQLYNGSSPAGSSLPGNGSPLDFGFHTTSGTYTITATNSSIGCTIVMTGSAVVVTDPLPAAYTVTGGGGYCPGGTGVHIGLSGSQLGTSYQLYLSGSPVGSPVAGTGTSLDFGLQTTIGAYSVVATMGICSQSMTGAPSISVYSLPYAYNVTSTSGSYCAGGSGVHIGLSSSQPGTTYSLYLGGVLDTTVSGTGSVIDFGLQTGAGIYTVTGTNTTTTCTNNMSGSATVSVNPLPTVYTVTGGGAYCAGGAGVHVGLNGSNTGINYQLYLGATGLTPLSGGTGSAIDFGLQTGAGAYTVVATNTSTGCTSAMTGTVSITITPTVSPAVSINVNPNDTVCAGTSVTYTALPVNGGASPAYQWFVNGSATATGSSYSYTPTNSDIITVTLTSSALCALPSSVNANVTMFVNPYPTITGATSICIGGTVTLVGTMGGTWTSSNPGVAIIATVGSTTGVISTVSTGVTTISYDLSGCVTTTVVTVNALPVISISGTTTCGGITTLTGSGATTYLWSPSTGLSCSTCASTDANPSTTTTYTVTGTAATGCSDTASVVVDGNRISGYISYSGSTSDTMKVWLIQFNSLDSSLTAEDSTLSCMAGGTPYYEFNDKAAGNYMVKAKLLGQTPGSSGYIPTYSLSTPYWYAAASVSHAGATDTMHINMVYGTVPPGPGFIAGYISSGAGKGTSGDIPAHGMIVYLRDAASNFVVTYTYTDDSGAYSFKNVGYGTYVIYPEEFGYHTTASQVITLISGSDSIKKINFKKYTTSKVVTPIAASSVSAISTGTGLKVYPNPTSGLLKLQWNNQGTEHAEVVINDMTGREAFRASVSINGTQGDIEIDLGKLKAGIYLLTIKSEQIYYCGKLMVE